MPLVRCDNCRMRPQAKYNGLYVAWFTQEQERVARKLRLCDACFQERVGPFAYPIDPAERLSCPSCGIDTDDDYRAIYGTVFVPGCAPDRLEIPFCEGCFAVFHEWASQRGESLEDRRRVDIDPTTHPSGLEVLRSMGIQPRVR